MRPSTSDLAMRRPALAALLGTLPSEGHFGAESTSFGGFGLEDELAGEFGFGDDGRMTAAAAGDSHFDTGRGRGGPDIEVAKGAFENLIQQRNADQRGLSRYQHLAALREERTARHHMVLDPNHGQTLKLGKYSFGLASAPITVGLASGLYMSDSPATTIRTKALVMNAPQVGFVTVSTVLIANVAVTVGGVEDAFSYSAQSFYAHRDFPTLPPSQKATFSGNYTSFAPAPLFNGQSFTFTVAFIGPSTIAGGA